MIERRSVAVTGLGLCSPLGIGEAAFWEAMLAGRHGVAPIRFMDLAGYRSRNGVEFAPEPLADALRARAWKPIDRVVDMALLAAADALEAAGLNGQDQAHTATLIGTSHGPTEVLEDVYSRYASGGRRNTRPTSIPRGMMNAISSQISIKFGLHGPNYMVASACSSSTNAIGLAFRMIRDGYADRVLCGGSDSFFTPTLYACWDKLGVMSTREDPNTACRPFAEDRDGFVLGEGAGMLLLEALDLAEARGAAVRGLVAGFGETSDATHPTRPSREGQRDAIQNAMASAGIEPEDLAFVSAHGTATVWNDSCEAHAIRLALGEAADRVPVVSQKAYFGHTLGAAGALETIVTLLALEQGLLPANRNLDNPDPACAVCLPREAPVPVSAPYAVKNSFGFGGGNASLVLRRHGEARPACTPPPDPPDPDMGDTPHDPK